MRHIRYIARNQARQRVDRIKRRVDRQVLFCVFDNRFAAAKRANKNRYHKQKALEFILLHFRIILMRFFYCIIEM